MKYYHVLSWFTVIFGILDGFIMLTPLYLPSFSLEHRQKICVTFEPRNAAPMEQHPKIRKLCEEDVAGQCLRLAKAKLLGILGTIMGNAVKTC